MESEREEESIQVEDSYLLLLNSIFELTIQNPLSSLEDLINPNIFQIRVFCEMPWVALLHSNGSRRMNL